MTHRDFRLPDGGKLRTSVYRWPRQPRPGTPRWLPGVRVERRLNYDYAEVFWPRIGGIVVCRLHKVSLLGYGTDKLIYLRDSWIQRGEIIYAREVRAGV